MKVQEDSNIIALAKVIKEVEDESELLPPCELPESNETDSESGQIKLETE